ncbi:MAG: hypothetical protein K2M12_09140 [Muribaculaceae bacterium]|nr:hypothetical protein [Muribaculaceae bacterium]
MKQYIVKTLFVAAAASFALTSCDYNSWNEEHLKGFEEPDLSDVQTVEYTLTADDYSKIAGYAANKTLAGEALASDLANVGKLHRFSSTIPAESYVPAFLSSTDFQYFSLSNGSAVKLTFNVADQLPEELDRLNATGDYTLTTADYQAIWESDEDYAEALSPAHAPKQAIPALLKTVKPDAQLGDYMVVNYNYSAIDPVFNATPDVPDVPGFQPTSVLDDIDNGDEITVRGWIAGVCARGYIVMDNSGAILVYFGGGINADDYPVGAQIEVSSTVSSYNKGWQLDGSAITSEVVTPNGAPFVAPTPTVLDGAAMDAAITRTDNALAQYVQYTGTVSVSGNYYNFLVDGAETAQGSGYMLTDAQKALFTDGAKQTITGWFMAVSGGRYVNTVVTNVSSAASAPARVAQVASTGASDVFYFDGSKWSIPDNVIAITADQCKEMTGYTTLTAAQANTNLPIFLKVKYPYATADTQKYVVYNEYKTGYVARQYIFDGNEWAENDGIEETTLQFVKNDGKWYADPSIVLVLPSGRNQAFSEVYYQACSDWVYENIDVPLGSTSITSGIGYVTSYGNNEYYSGTSAYQNNVDLRGDKARAQYPAGYEGMTDDEIVALMKKRFEEEVMPGALAKIHPDLTPMYGTTVTVTVTFGTYDGSNGTETGVWAVVGPGKFEFVSCTWNK